MVDLHGREREREGRGEREREGRGERGRGVLQGWHSDLGWGDYNSVIQT